MVAPRRAAGSRRRRKRRPPSISDISGIPSFLYGFREPKGAAATRPETAGELCGFRLSGYNALASGEEPDAQLHGGTEMTRLEALRPGATVRGLLPDAPAAVLSVQGRCGSPVRGGAVWLVWRWGCPESIAGALSSPAARVESKADGQASVNPRYHGDRARLHLLGQSTR